MQTTEVTNCSKCGRPFRRHVTKNPKRQCGDEGCGERAKAAEAEGPAVR